MDYCPNTEALNRYMDRQDEDERQLRKAEAALAPLNKYIERIFRDVNRAIAADPELAAKIDRPYLHELIGGVLDDAFHKDFTAFDFDDRDLKTYDRNAI